MKKKGVIAGIVGGALLIIDIYIVLFVSIVNMHLNGTKQWRSFAYAGFIALILLAFLIPFYHRTIIDYKNATVTWLIGIEIILSILAIVLIIICLII